jgi:hypothetical protein
MLDAQGNPIGSPAPIASMPSQVRELADGTYVVFWESGGSITAQRYAPDGSPMGELIAIGISGVTPQIAGLADVGFALAWSAPGAGADLDVFTQRFGEQLTSQRKACLNSAKAQGLRGLERKAFMTGCMGTP